MPSLNVYTKQKTQSGVALRFEIDINYPENGQVPRLGTATVTVYAKATTTPIRFAANQWWEFTFNHEVRDLYTADYMYMAKAKYPTKAITLNTDAYTKLWSHQFEIDNSLPTHNFWCEICAQYTSPTNAYTFSLRERGYPGLHFTTTEVPQNVQAERVDTHTINFTWDAVSNADKYLVSGYIEHLGGETNILFTPEETYETDRTSYTLNLSTDSVSGFNQFLPGDTIHLSVRSDNSLNASEITVIIPGTLSVRVNEECTALDNAAPFRRAIPYVKVNGVWKPAYTYARTDTLFWKLVHISENSLNKGVD